MKKTYILSALAIVAMGMTSCSDFLDQKAATDLSAQEVYENTSMTELRINSLYGALTTDRTYGQDLAVTFCNNTDIECVNGLKTDGNNTEATYRGWGNYYNNTLLADSKNYDMYNELFGITENANLTIQGIKNSKILANGSLADQKMMKGYLGEAYTMRAIAFFNLIRLYGDVPVNFEVTKDDLSNVSTAKVNRDVIMDKLIEDLTEAEELVPWVGDNGYTTERITRGYVLGLKAQIALTRAGWSIREKDMGEEYESEANADAVYPTQRPVKEIRNKYYQIAAEALAKVIRDGKHSLNPDFANLWYNVNQRTLDPSHENMFEIPFGLNKSGELGYSIGVPMKHQTAELGYKNSSSHMNLTAKLIYDYGKCDTRRNVTCALLYLNSTAGDNQTKSGTRKELFIGNKPFGIPCGKWDPRMMAEDWKKVNLSAEGKFGYGINYIMMRYSHVLLMYAEALNELENEGIVLEDMPMSKYEALRLVRARAIRAKEGESYGSNDPNKFNNANYADFFKAIVDENELEFAGEGVRKYELIRWNLLCSKINETRVSTQMGINQNNNVEWDGKVNFMYVANSNNNIIDINTYTIGLQNETGVVPEKGSYNENKTFCGKDKNGVISEDNKIDAQHYCAGLIGGPGIRVAVKNRHLIPLSNQALTAAGISNSYGY